MSYERTRRDEHRVDPTGRGTRRIGHRRASCHSARRRSARGRP